MPSHAFLQKVKKLTHKGGAMKKGSEKQRKKYRIPLFAAACVVFLIAVLVLYSITGENMVTYYYETEGDITLISASPSHTDGVSQDAAIVLEWSRPVTAELADAVRISPSVRGEWFVSGNYLMFTPRQFAAGTYYSVTIPKGTILTEDGETLEETVFFSFETEDPNLRLPSAEAFSVDGRGFVFSENENAVLPVNIAGEDTAVDVTVYRASNHDAFINAFAEWFCYPSWASLSIAAYHGDERGFDKISDSEMAVRRGNDLCYVDLGSLSGGQYLVRIAAGDDSYDVPVTVSSVDVGIVYEDHAIALWSHAEGEPYANADVSFLGKSYIADENGFVSFPCTLTPSGIHRDPATLAIILSGEKGDMVCFLTADDLEAHYDSDLVVNDRLLQKGDSLTASGTIFTENGIAVNGVAVLRLESAADTISEKKVKIENGCFTVQWNDLRLPDGDYDLNLYYDNRELETEFLRMGKEIYELRLTVEKSADTVESGHSVRYDVQLTDENGEPVTDALVSMNGENGVAVDQNGQVVFRKAYALHDGLVSMQKDAHFSVDSPYGDAEEVTVSVSVVAGDGNTGSTVKAETIAEQKENLALTLNKQGFSLVGEEETPQLYMIYSDHDYDVKALGENVALSVPEKLVTAVGDEICAELTVTGDYRLAVVSLCKGRIPDAFCGMVRTEEGLYDHGGGTLEELRVFFGEEEISAVFSTANRNGDYYLRVAVKDGNGNVFVRYVPVTVYGVTVDCPEERSFAAGSMVTLDFSVSHSSEAFDYVLTIGEEVYRGEAAGDFSVFTEIASSGQYHGDLVLYREDVAIASKAFDFEVYRKAPMFTAVSEGNADGAFYTCMVKDTVKDAFIKAFEIMDLPGDQILQRMGKTLYYRFFGEVVDGDLSDLNYDLSAFQNEDGSFGRYIGAPGDILLSVFVAEQEDFVYDRDSLCAYLKYRLKKAEDPETAALACWGLGCFDVDCSESMAMIASDHGLTDRTLLYLAEGYEAAGRNEEAEKIYGQLEKELTEENGMLSMPQSEDQYHIANTAFMLDLALKLDKEEARGLLDFLVSADIRIQSGRYLLISSIVRMVDGDEIAAVKNGRVKNGYTQLSVAAKELENVPILNTSFVKDGATVTSVSAGEAVELHLQWTADENSIYLVYVTEVAGASVIEKDGLIGKKGYYEVVTKNGSASISFEAVTAGEQIAPRVYIVDLTTGQIVGRSDESGWQVTK